ncbi:MAG: pyruvate dehydrogenase complex dihydrolipoamide acetyltransferase [Saprospiraceae bacterium]
MAEVIKMPRMSDTMEEGNIVAWHKQVGDEVEIGDLLAEVETDKATMDFESPADGFLLHIAIEEGTVAIGGIMAIIGEKGENISSLLEGDAQEEVSTSVLEKEEETPVEKAVSNIETEEKASDNDDERVKASPLAKSMAKEAGVNLTSIAGSGDNGRIVKKDIEAFLSGNVKTKVAITKTVEKRKPVASPASKPQPILSGGTEGNYEDVPVSQMRKVIARRLGESKFSAPHFYLAIKIRMDKAIETRKKLNEIATTKISFNDLVVKSAAASLRKHPNINSSWLGDRIRYNKDVNIGVAVAVDEGLLVPVIKNTDQKTLTDINTEVRALAGKAKDRKLQPQEMQGNTFTISNLGMFGIEEFTAIINPPDACILAVGTIVKEPVVEGDQIVVGSTMKVTLSCDHRVVDGAMGASFLQTFKSIMEDPIRMLV